MISSPLISIFVLVLNIIVLVYLGKLESVDCKCAESYKKTYIKVYSITSIVNGIIVPVLAIILGSKAVDRSHPPTTLQKMLSLALLTWIIIFFIATVIYYIFAFQYINRLRDEDCTCSDSPIRKTWEIMLIIRIILFVITLTIGLFAVGSIRGMGASRELTREEGKNKENKENKENKDKKKNKKKKKNNS